MRDNQGYYDLEPPIKVQKLGAQVHQPTQAVAEPPQNIPGPQYSIVVPQTSNDLAEYQSCQFCDKKFDTEKELGKWLQIFWTNFLPDFIFSGFF